MLRWTILAAIACCLTAHAEIYDRVAIVVGKQIVKDSDIDRDIRITSFLNGEQPVFGPASRKQAGNRLIDQALIREQIRSGEFPMASRSESDLLLDQIKKDRFPTDADYKRSLAHWGISESELRDRLLWQLTALRFIDARFRPAAVVTDEEITQYQETHSGQPQPTVQQTLEGERITKLLNEWLDQGRKEIRIDYLEKELQ